MAERPFPIDFSTLVVDSRPRCCLALPADFPAEATPDLTSPVFDLAPAALLDVLKAVALAEARTELVRGDDAQVELVQRSAVFKFPDYITAQAVDSDGGASLCLYSRAVIGHSDLGVNTKRLKRWLEAVKAKV